MLSVRICRGPWLSKADRDTNILRIGFVSHLLSRNGVIAVSRRSRPIAKRAMK